MKIPCSYFAVKLVLLATLLCPPTFATPLQPAPNGTATDPATGLVWMRCLMGQTWDGTTCTGTANSYSFDRATALTSTVTFAGQRDWRLPNIRELTSIFDFSVSTAALDVLAFPNAAAGSVWSGTPYAGHTFFAWSANFGNGSAIYSLRSAGNSVRLVRGGQSLDALGIARLTSDYVTGGDGTVIHKLTGLKWQRCLVGQSWNGTTCTGAASTFTWDNARALTSNLAGQTGWRLPTEQELLSLVDYTKSAPAVNTTIFPGDPGLHVWSATPNAGNTQLAWNVYFRYGGTFSIDDRSSNNFAARLVQAEQPLTAITFAPVADAARSGSVTSSPITVSGVFGSAPISITNGEYQVNGGAWTAGAGTVKNGDTVKVRVNASATPGEMMRATLTIAGISGSFTVTTKDEPAGWGTVADPQTGLIWMRCLMGQTWEGTSGCQGAGKTYTWDQAYALTDKTNFAGFNDWRLPSVRELLSLADWSFINPALNKDLFNVGISAQTWSRTWDAGRADFAWSVKFDWGIPLQDYRTSSLAVRMVRGNEASLGFTSIARPDADYQIADDGTVTHTPTGLQWQRCKVGQTWNGSTCSGLPTPYTWDQAKALTSNFADQTDWRLPTMKELVSTVDYARANPAVNTMVFPGETGGYAWTTTPVGSSSTAAWFINLSSGFAYTQNRSSVSSVRLVRKSWADTNCFFDWAEGLLPDTLTPAKTTTMIVGDKASRSYRDNLLFGVDQNAVFAVGGIVGPQYVNLGQLGDFISLARSTGCK